MQGGSHKNKPSLFQKDVWVDPETEEQEPRLKAFMYYCLFQLDDLFLVSGKSASVCVCVCVC